jgi:hypothetical protein
VEAQPSVSASYYAPLTDFLRGTPHHDAYRVEVLPEAHHWESAYVPQGIYIARGWERQLDRARNPLFYQSTPLTSLEYRSWLDDLGVGYVAVPDAPLDYAALAEKKLIKRGPPSYLKKVFRSKDWTVYAVQHPAPLAIGGRMVKLTPEGFVVDANAPGTVLVRVHWTPYWSIEQGSGCVEQAPGGYTMLDVATPGRFRVGVAFSPLRAIDGDPRCHQEPVIQYGSEQSSSPVSRARVRGGVGR